MICLGEQRLEYRRSARVCAALDALQRVCQQEHDTLLELIVPLVVLQFLQLLRDVPDDQLQWRLVPVVCSSGFANEEAE